MTPPARLIWWVDRLANIAAPSAASLRSLGQGRMARPMATTPSADRWPVVEPATAPANSGSDEGGTAWLNPVASQR